MKKKPLEIEFDGDELVAAVQETVKLYREGRLGELRTRERKPLKPLKPAQIRAIRKKWGASQAIFADILNVPKEDVYFVGERLQESKRCRLEAAHDRQRKARSPLGYLSASTEKKVLSNRI